MEMDKNRLTVSLTYSSGVIYNTKAFVKKLYNNYYTIPRTKVFVYIMLECSSQDVTVGA